MELSRAGPIMGCASVVSFVITWTVSAMLWGEWRLWSNSLSSIGVCDVMAAEIVFNVGCIVSGLLAYFFGLSLLKDRNFWFRWGGVTMVVCGIACVLIGILDEDFGMTHLVIGGVYAGFASGTMAITGAGDFIEGRKDLTILATVLLLICGFFGILDMFLIFEPIAIICILIWTFVQSIYMDRRNNREMV